MVVLWLINGPDKVMAGVFSGERPVRAALGRSYPEGDWGADGEFKPVPFLPQHYSMEFVEVNKLMEVL
jgi:hypothetical protein